VLPVNIKKGVLTPEVCLALYTWWCSIKEQHYSKAIWAPHTILDDNTCDLLASVGPIATRDHLAWLIQTGWAYWDKHVDKLFQFLDNINIASLQPLPKSAPSQPSTECPINEVLAPSQSMATASTPAQK